jgi:hypothetical protein
MQKRFQVVEAEGTTNRDGLCCVSCPKLTVWVAANCSKDCLEVKSYHYRSRPRNAYALRQSANCLGLRQRIYFRKREPWTERTQGKRKQEVNPLTFHSILRHASENRVRSGSRMVDGEEGSIRQFRRIPIRGIIFSALALLFHVYFEQRIDFITLSRKRRLGSCAKI